MRKFLHQIVAFCKADFHLGTYLATLGLIALLVALNYSLGIAASTVYDRDIQGMERALHCTLFFAVPYFAALGIQVLFHGKEMKVRLRQPGFWGLLLLCMALLILTFTTRLHRDLALQWFSQPLQNWGIKLLWNLKRVVFFILPLLLVWLLAGQREDRFYGLFTRPKGLLPYALLLLVMVPAVIWASYQPSFIQAYPQYYPGTAKAQGGYSPWFTAGLYELVYGFDFTGVELAYRGVLVIGLSRWLGTRAVLPMIVLYVAIHFGKPLGEAVASIIAGFVLGVTAYASRNIWGGILLHVGSAWLMELAAYWQRGW